MKVDRIRLSFSIFLLVSALSLSLPVNAADIPANNTFPNNPANQTVGPDGGVGSGDPTSSGFQIVSCTGVVDPRTGTGVECNYSQFIITFKRVVQFVLYLLIPIVLVMIIYTGFKYMTAQGDSGKLADAKRMFVPILIGLVCIFGAWLIVYTFLDYILALKIGEVNKSDIVPAGIRQP
jgi:hypothetical protein